MKFIKKAKKEGFRFKATDDNGQTFLYKEKPNLCKMLGLWTNTSECLFFRNEGSSKGWKKSLKKIA